MKKQEFLKGSYLNKRYLETDWWVRCLSNFSDPDVESVPKKPFTLVKQPWGLASYNQDLKLEPIEDYDGDGSLFKTSDQVRVDPTWLVNIEAALDTTFGILAANAVLLTEVFGKKIPFINREVTISGIESIIMPRLHSDPENMNDIDPNDLQKIYVFEYLKMNYGIQLIATVMDLFTVGLTKKTLLPPPGIEEKKKELLKTPGLNLNDPIQMAAFEKELLAFDREYLKDDPSLDKFASGKILKDSRKKLFLSMGAEGGFRKDGGIIGISKSLSEGLPTDPDQYVATINGARAGSFSRGYETMQGGVAAKRMLAASNNYVIVEGNCGSEMGISRKYFPWLVNSLKGRTIINGKTQYKVTQDDDVSKYLGQVVRTRSPMYCRMPGEEICSTCAGDAMAKYKTGIALPLTEVSHAILTASMKAMHTNSLTVNDFNLDELFT